MEMSFVDWNSPPHTLVTSPGGRDRGPGPIPASPYRTRDLTCLSMLCTKVFQSPLTTPPPPPPSTSLGYFNLTLSISFFSPSVPTIFGVHLYDGRPTNRIETPLQRRDNRNFPQGKNDISYLLKFGYIIALVRIWVVDRGFNEGVERWVSVATE